MASPVGFTRKNLNKARFINDYKNFGFSEPRFFSFIDGLLDDLNSKADLISHQALNKVKTSYEINNALLDIATAFSLKNSKGEKAYFLPVREWFYNKTLPVLTAVGRSADAAGIFFEQELAGVLKALSEDNLRFIYSPLSGMVPILKQPSKEKKVVKLNWKIIAKNVKISLDDPVLSAKVGKEGEIDLVVYANYHLYLLELKSLNLSSGRTKKYINEKAASQCMKYSAWVKQKDFLDFLQENGLSNDDFRAVRIICCTNGVYDNLEICFNNSERFAVIPQYALFSLLAGVFTVAMREILPDEIMGLRNGVLNAIPTIQEIGIVDLREEISKVANGIINRWFSLMTFDRRKNYSEINLGKAIPLFMSKFYSIVESYLGDTWKWILDQPVQIGAAGDWKYYVGTQICEAGTTLICPHCKTAVKYYHSPDEDVEAAVEDILKNRQCPFCGRLIVDNQKPPEILMMMSKFVIDHKRHNDDKLLDENLREKRIKSQKEG